jgi:DNA-binding SARP family transcriptional activator
MPDLPSRETVQRGLIRPRLHQLATEGDARFVCSIVAPAGYGKTTLLHELARQHKGPVAQISATVDSLYGQSLTERVLRDLAAQVDTDLAPSLVRSISPGSAASNASALPASLITVDDAHLFSGTPGENQLSQLVALAGPQTQIIFAGRADPAIDLHSLRMNNSVCEIGADDLRFRSWEVEELFQRVFGVRLPPRELASLAATTQGWAAGLQLYRHATQRSSDTARVQQLELLRQSRLEAVRSYLSANVLSGLDDDLRSFALGSSVLGRMDPGICNRLLNRIDSQRCLDRLVSSQLFTTRSDDGSFRYHEIFRSYLEAELVVGLDSAQIQELYTRAAKLLEDTHSLPDALRAHTMAGNDADVERLVRSLHEESAYPHPNSPAWLLSDDHARLARARSLIRSGRSTEGFKELTALISAPISDEVRSLAVWERDRIRRWLEPTLRPVDPTDWTSIVREAVKECGSTLGESPDIVLENETLIPFTRAIVSFLEGRVKDSARQFADLEITVLDGPLAIIASALGALAWWLVDGQDPSFTLSDLRDSTDRENSGWVTLLLRATLLGFPVPHDPPVIELLAQLDDHAEVCGDRWAPAIGRLFMLLGSANGTLRAIDDAGVQSIEHETTRLLRTLGAETLAVWSIAARALIQRRRHDEQITSASAETSSPTSLGALALQHDLAWAIANPGRVAASLKDWVPTWTDPQERDSVVIRFGLLSRFLEFGSYHSNGSANLFPQRSSSMAGFGPSSESIPTSTHTSLSSGRNELERSPQPIKGTRPNPNERIISVTLFGPFSIRVNGVALPLSNLRPQAKSILRFLALRAAPVHREVIVDTMWPDADPEAARKRLYVAISAIRQELGIAASAMERTGDTYSLCGNGWALCSDVGEFDRATEAHQLLLRRACNGTTAAASRSTDPSRNEEALRAAEEIVGLYLGELLPEEGPQDWAVHEREFRMRTYLRAIAILVAWHQEQRDWDSVERYAQLGLRADRYQEDLWTPLLNALEKSGRTSELRSAKVQYSAFLAELGVA